MKILIYIPNIRLLGGAENQCLLLAEYLFVNKCEVTILSDTFNDMELDIPLDWTSIMIPNSQQGILFSNEYSIMSLFTIFHYKSIPVIFLEKKNIEIYHFLFNNVDIVHFHMLPYIADQLLPMLIKMNKKFTLRFVSSNENGDSEQLGKKENLIKTINLSKAPVIALDLQIKKELINIGLNKNQINVISNGIDVDSFIPKKKFNNEIQFLFLGRFVPKKKIPCILEAYRHYLDFGKIGKLKIVGDGVMKGKLYEISNQNNLAPNNIFVDPIFDVKEKISYLQNCDVFLYPTVGDATPNSLLEAMSCGLVPIVSNDPGYDFLTDGFNCLKIKTGDANDLANKMVFVSSNKSIRDFIGNNARKTIIDNFTKEKSGNNYLNIFKLL